MNYNMEKMEELGISDYYLGLTQYISRFVNYNYPLTKEDMIAIINDKQTENIIRRNMVTSVLKESMVRILSKEAEENQKKVDDWGNGVYSAANDVQDQNTKMVEFIQLMLEDLWNYQNGYNEIEDEKKNVGRK